MKNKNEMIKCCECKRIVRKKYWKQVTCLSDICQKSREKKMDAKLRRLKAGVQNGSNC